MSKIFNTKVNDARNLIQEECKLFNINYQEFLPLIHQITSCNDIAQETIQLCSQFAEELNEGNIRLIFCGQVKSGKSRCIIEFLSGKLNLPSCETPTTTFFTVIFLSEQSKLFSENDKKEKIYYDFDGINVANGLVGRINDSKVYEGDLQMIYYVGTSNTFIGENFIVIDTPGLNETKTISDAFFNNLEKLNPQLIVYLFDAGPGITVSDIEFCAKVIAKSRKKLKKIFLFNKYDVAFKIEPTFQLGDSEENVSVHDNEDDDDDDYEPDDDDDNDDGNNLKDNENNIQQYEIDYQIHWNKLNSFIDSDEPTLIGYSGKLIKIMRQQKENNLPFLLDKHIDFLNEIKNKINMINMETIDEIIKFTEDYLFVKFKTVYDQILQTKDKDYRRITINIVAKNKLLRKFDLIHKEINIQQPKINQLELDCMINEIIENQVKQSHENTSSKLEKITNSLVQFFTNRYINLFSNVIQSALDCVSFDSLVDDIKKNDLNNIFQHTFCTLKHEAGNYNLTSVIENYFRLQITYLNLSSINLSDYNLNSSEGHKQFFKTYLKYNIEYIFPIIEEYKMIKLNTERKYLENSIDRKITEINSDFKMTELETEKLIKDTMDFFKKWIKFNNNYIITMTNGSAISDEKRKFYERIINGIENCNGEIQRFSKFSIICKKELVNFDEINCKNCDIIQYFLRTQYISSHLLKCQLFFNENMKQLYFITNIDDFQPLRRILPNLKKTEKDFLIQRLIEIVEELYNFRLPIYNFGSDMIFCKRISTDLIDIKLSETVQQYHQWNYTLENEEKCNDIFYRYPFHNSNNSIGETILSMFYCLVWTIMIIKHGNCQTLINGKTFDNNYRKIIDHYLINSKLTLIKQIVDKCLKRPFETNILLEILKLLRKLKE